MNQNIDLALNRLYQRQIITREQLLNEILRVKLVQKELETNNEIQTTNVVGVSTSTKKQVLSSSLREKLFQLMKKTTEDDLGFFPADRDDFIDIYDVLKEIDLIEFTLEIFKNDKMGTIISPIHLTTYMKNAVKDINPKKILITEAEKHLSGLKEFIQEFNESHITLTTELKPMYLLLKLVFSSYENIKIIFESIYSDCLLDEKFDYIYTLPSFGYKIDNIGRSFITKDSDGIAIENMLGHLDEKGILDIIVPAKITFSGMEYEKLRSFITNNYNVKSIFILPEGTFRPSTAIKTYLFEITKSSQDKIEIGTLNLNKAMIYKETPTPNVVGISDSHKKQVFGSLLKETPTPNVVGISDSHKKQVFGSLLKETPAPDVVGISDSHQKQVLGSLLTEDRKQIETKEFLSHEDWRIELLLSDDDENIKKFKDSDLKKVKLKDVAEVFRGKSILKKDTTVGNISVLNISNIENGEIKYDNMDTINEDERKVKRYELIKNDVVLSCRGTAIKSAVIKETPTSDVVGARDSHQKQVLGSSLKETPTPDVVGVSDSHKKQVFGSLLIASANVIVIRPNDKILGEYIKIFFESPIGMAIIKSFQRGTTIMNINYSDIMEMEIPLLSMDEQKKMIENYNEELSIYKDATRKAENRWNNIKNNIYNKLT